VSGPYLRIITNSLAYLRRERGLAIHAYVIMPTHFHAIVTAVKDDLSAIMRDFKRFTGRAIYTQAEEDGNQLLAWLLRKAAEKEPRNSIKVWQDEFHPEVVYTGDFFRQKADYIHANPIRKGLAANPQEWHYSSAKQYLGEEGGPLEVDWLEW
jgi:putative transposase